MAGRLPLVYACSGCSSAAQMANHMALELDAAGLAEMSCISGVGGGVPGLERTAQSGRPLVALDGCELACCAACLARVGRSPDLHLVLREHGVRKQKRVRFDPVQAGRVLREVVMPALAGMPRTAEEADGPG